MAPLTQLPIELPQRGSRSLLGSLHQQLRTAILDGRLQPGVRLPSTRALAAEHGVSRNTTVAAYELLLSEGYLSARRGSGTTVAESLRRPSQRGGHGDRTHSQLNLNPYWRGRGMPAYSFAAAAPRYSFQVGLPDPASFPFDTWRRLSGRVLRAMRTVPQLTFEPQGLAALREAVAQHVSFSRAVACGPDDIVITAGAQQAFDLLARVLTTPGRTTVVIENPGYPPLRAAFQAQGARIVPVPVDAEGLVVDRVPAQARVVCVTPSHQFPLGTVMSAQRRAALLTHCQQRAAVIIEDDYDGDFRFADRPLDALQTLDRTQSVFYVGTFSKCLSPDLRMGYIVAPPWATAALVAAKLVCDGQRSRMAQSTLALLIREGHLARHVRRMQRIYNRRRNLLLDALQSTCNQWLEALPSVAGLHVAARLRGGWDEESVIARARIRGVGIGALRPYYVGRPGLRGIVLGYGTIDENTIVEGLNTLRRSLVA
jgi:GntR family transcriptional regulator/MocR family aminotransferase